MVAAYFVTTLTSQNFFRTEIKSRFKSGVACYNCAEPFVFQFAIQKYKHLDIQNYNFTLSFVWV